MTFLALISPAKRLNFDGPRRDLPLSEPAFAAQSRKLIKLARDWDVVEIMHKMSLSNDLATLNHGRYQDFKMRGDGGTRQAALDAFAGDVYLGLDAASLSDEQAMAANDCLRILSGLYGLLRPLDLIQPYRLEMGTRVETDAGNSLYAFWGTTIAKALNASGASTVLNLASQEYWGAVQLKALKLPVVTCHFKEMRNGKPTIISFMAKKARGLMARFLIEREPQTIEDLQGFNADGYSFAPALSDAENMVFLKDS